MNIGFDFFSTDIRCYIDCGCAGFYRLAFLYGRYLYVGYLKQMEMIVYFRPLTVTQSKLKLKSIYPAHKYAFY